MNPPQSQKSQTSAEAPVKKPAKCFEFSVEMRWRNEIRDNADLQPGNDFNHFVGERLRIDLRARLHPHLSVFFEAQDVWLINSASDKVIHDLDTNLHQLHFGWKPVGSEHWELLAGRQEFIYGEERLIGAFGWDNVGRSFDAARLR